MIHHFRAAYEPNTRVPCLGKAALGSPQGGSCLVDCGTPCPCLRTGACATTLEWCTSSKAWQRRPELQPSPRGCLPRTHAHPPCWHRAPPPLAGPATTPLQSEDASRGGLALRHRPPRWRSTSSWTQTVRARPATVTSDAHMRIRARAAHMRTCAIAPDLEEARALTPRGALSS